MQHGCSGGCRDARRREDKSLMFVDSSHCYDIVVLLSGVILLSC